MMPLLVNLTSEWMNSTFWIVVILVYYLLATLLTIDKLIGKRYSVFGAVLVIMVVSIIGGALSVIGVVVCLFRQVISP